jgi:6-phosphogluconolactonase
LYLDGPASARVFCRLNCFLVSFALAFLSTLTGCGGPAPMHCLEACPPASAEVLYVGSGGPLQSSGQIEAFSIDTSSGSLGQPSITAGPLGGMAATSNSAFLYIADSGNNQILGYGIDATNGSLTQIPSSPVAYGSSNQRGGGVAIDPSNRFLYATDSAAGTITGFTIDGPTGALTPLAPPFSAGFQLTRMVIDPAGKYLEVVDGFLGISSFALDPASGVLTPGASGAVTFVSNAFPIDMALHPSGNFLYLALGLTAVDSGVMGFTVDRSTGFPTPVGSNASATGLAPGVVVGDPMGRFLYTANRGDGTISGFSISGTTGGLQPLPKSPYTLGLNPPPAGGQILLNMVIDQNGEFLYVTNSENSNISVFRISANGDLNLTGQGTLNSNGPGPMLVVKLP